MLLTSISSFAQGSQLFTIHNNLSSSLVNHIYQDSRGMIWVSTEDGLNRYDGVKFNVYRHHEGDSTSLVDNYVRSVGEDDQGNLYVATHKGLQVYDRCSDAFTPPARWKDGSAFSSHTFSVVPMGRNKVWATGFTLVEACYEHGRVVVEKVALKQGNMHTGAAMLDANGDVWILKAEAGVYHVKKRKGNEAFKVQFYPVYGIDVNLTDICITPHHQVYVTDMGEGRVLQLQGHRFITVQAAGLESRSYKAVTMYNHNQLLLSTDGGGLQLFTPSRNEAHVLTFDCQGLNPYQLKAHSSIIDHEGNLWVAIYQKGVAMIPARQNGFNYMGYKSAYQNIVGRSCVTSLCQSHDGVMWVGTDGDGLYALTPQSSTQKPPTEYSLLHHYAPGGRQAAPPSVFGLCEDSAQRLWLGSFTHGAFYIDPRTRDIHSIKLVDKSTQRVEQRVFAFAQDAHERLWIATMGSGLFCYDLKQNECINMPGLNEQLNKWIDALYYHSPQHTLCVATYDGLRMMRFDSHGEVQKVDRCLGGTIIYCITSKSGSNDVWLGTNKGLLKHSLITQKTDTIGKRQGLLSNNVRAVEFDGMGHLWVSTGNGLSQIVDETGKIVSYEVSDGIQAGELSHKASCRDAWGRLWFGGTEGVCFFSPQQVAPVHSQWKVRLVDFYVSNRAITQTTLSDGKPIVDVLPQDAKCFTLSHTDNTISLELSTQSLAQSDRLTYLYTMDDGAWIAVPKGSSRITLYNLSSGTHRLRLKVKDNAYESPVKELIVKVRYPWYATIWARLIYLVLVLSVLFIIVRLLILRYRAKQALLESRRAEEVGQAKLQFFINIGHEIRTPMSLIMAPLNKLMNHDADTDRLRQYHIIHKGAQRILRLINQLMDVRKLEKGQMHLTFTPLHLGAMLTDVADMFTSEAERRNITFSFENDLEEDADVAQIDVNHFDKIIINLLSNAFKFTPDGGSITLSLSRSEQPPRQLFIRVEDSGVGIPEGERELIFKRFYQVENAAVSGESTGTGVGLHLVQLLVELHGGSIRAKSALNYPTGSLFEVLLPVSGEHCVAETSALSQLSNIGVETVASVRASSTPITHFRVLVVEDDASVRNYLQTELSRVFHTSVCNNGTEALTFLATHVIDLVLSDVMMPFMDGITLCKKIKTNPRLNHMGVVLLTAKNTQQDYIEGLDTGADAYITKPFDIDILVHTLRNLMVGRERLRITLEQKQEQLDKLSPTSETPLSPNDDLMQRVMSCISHHLSDPDLSVETLAGEVGISRVHLHRKLKEITNQTTRDLIRNTRLQYAAKLLREHRCTIKDVAYRCGFNKPNNFTVAFKDYYGVSPTDYAKEPDAITLPHASSIVALPEDDR